MESNVIFQTRSDRTENTTEISTGTLEDRQTGYAERGSRGFQEDSRAPVLDGLKHGCTVTMNRKLRRAVERACTGK